MKKLKRIFAVFFCLLLAAGILGGCGKAASSSAPAPSALQSGNKPLKIVTTIFPEYDWVREILGDKADRAEVTMLLDNGVDLHSYQPTADDIIKISDCDLFIYVGGESDGWVEDALKEATNKEMQVINLLDPDVIVLGGGLSNVNELYEAVPRLWTPHVFSDSVRTAPRPAQHGDSSGVRGAAWLTAAP